MKKQIHLFLFSIIILFSILAALLFVAHPVIAKAKSEMQKLENNYISIISEKTGLSISYKSLSPSIISGLRLSSIVLYDKTANEQIAEIKSIKLNWNIFKMIDGDFSDALGDLIISGGFFNYNEVENSSVRKKIIKIFSERETSNASDFTLPINILIKNSAFVYTDENISFTLRLSKLNLFTQESTGFLAIDSRGAIKLTLSQKNNFPVNAFSFNYLLQGGVSSSFKESYAQLSFYDMDTSLFSAERLDFYVTHTDTNVTLKLIQNGKPFEITGSYNTKTSDMNIALNAKDFQPLSVVTFKKSKDFNVSHFYNTEMTGVCSLSYNINSKNLDYQVDGNIKLPDSLIKGGIDADIDLEGTVNQVNISKLAVHSKYCDASYSGSLDIKNLLPFGVLNIERISLPSGNTLATDVYISPVSNGFLCFIPQLTFGAKSLTAIQLNIVIQKGSIDFSFEATDYSYVDISDPGTITLTGSFDFLEDSFLQMQISCKNFFIETALAMAQWSVPKENITLISSLQSIFKDYIFTFDAFISSDLEHITYNAPYFIAANISKENEMMLLSLDGTEERMHLSQFEILFAGQKLDVNFNLDFSDKKETFFSSDISFNSIPYTFSGFYEANKFLSISGNYGFYADVTFTKDAAIAKVNMESLPLNFNDYNFLLELQSQYNYGKNGWLYTINNFTIQEISGKLISNPRLQFAGVLDKYGFTSSSLVYNDSVSTLEGTVGMGWDFSEYVLHSAFLNLDLSEDFSPEKILLSVEANNPKNALIQSDDFFNNLFFNVEGEINEFQFAHVLNGQTSDDTLSFSLNALGSVDMPSVQVNVNRAKITTQGMPVVFSGPILLQDKDISFDECKLSFGTYEAKDLTGQCNLSTMSGKASTLINGQLQPGLPFSTKTFESQMSANFYTVTDDLNDGNNKFVVDVILQKLTGTFFNDRYNVPIHVEKNSEKTLFYISEEKALSGVIYSDGGVHIEATKDSPISFVCDGYMNDQGNYLAFNDIFADGTRFSKILDLKEFTLYSGNVTGFLSVEGKLDAPIINGHLIGTDARATSPICTNETMYADYVDCDIDNSKFSFNNVLLTGEKSKGLVNLFYSIDLETLSSVTQHVTVKSVGSQGFYGHFVVPVGEIEATTTLDLDMDFAPSENTIIGNVNATDIEAVISSFSVDDDNEDTNANNSRTYTDITINIDQKAQVYIPSKTNPLVRGLVGQIKPIHFIMDTGMYTYSLEGEIIVKSGEILYINRTFYIKNGMVNLDGNQDLFDPIISFSAEIPEQDEEGNLVKIILSAEEQRLSNFSPILYSEPSKSNTEIMSLLGQAVIGDADSLGTAVASGFDYILQIGIFRIFENSLRDLFNFDIFSFRTTFLQNAMIDAFDTDDTSSVSFGNYLDGSTVYIGKYIGNTLYADMMLEIVYDEDVANSGSESGLGLEPEIGLELPSPFATIRWSIAPEANSDWNLLVPYTSISLSWKFML
ncbi:MAG: hypothetical protein BKP49_09470 [Treponema sp. CETP13]|nr:MAG: hypothetical protein BKP49_09470 [Treponema sp. CETP13]